ncbi:GPI-anchored protein LLG1-like [Triticum urartu]|uniref:GPI-anchored protein LLG1-like n=1 Tax=Triticum urartu TaxID=4572 RepID=UPI002043987F|nr:GPI-anchored protein LLG1-like [Triticum urartu]
MGSTGATAVLLSCVVLSIVAAGSAASDKPLIISNAALLASPPEASSSSGRKLGGFMEAGLCPLQLEHLKQMGKVQSSCLGQATPQPRCCTAFKDFVCPYGATMNDIDNGCAGEMMATIQELCKVPKGYFAMCGDSPQGITC